MKLRPIILLWIAATVFLFLELWWIHRFKTAQATEPMVGYSLYDALRDRGMQERSADFVRCHGVSQSRCSPGDRMGDGRQCYSVAMSQCMTPTRRSALPTDLLE